MEENEKLTKENKKLKKDFEDMRSDVTHLTIAIAKLRRKKIYIENQKLKKIILDLGLTKDELNKRLKNTRVNLFEWIW